MISGILSFVGSAAGLATLIPSPIQPILGVVAGVASIASVVIDCVLRPDLVGCMVSAIFAFVNRAGIALKAGLKLQVEQWVRDAIYQVLKIIGINGDAVQLSICVGRATQGNFKCQG